MGGLSAVMQPYARANHKEIPTFQVPSYLFYFDVNSMYPACMCEPMPTGRAVPVTLPEEPSSRLVWLHNLLDKGSDPQSCTSLVLDFDFPEDLHDGLDFAPPCRMRVCQVPGRSWTLQQEVSSGAVAKDLQVGTVPGDA